MGSYLKLKYVFIFYAIIRFPLHQLTGLQDSAGRIYSLLLLIILIYYVENAIKQITRRKHYRIWQYLGINVKFRLL